VETIQKRGGAVIEARGASSAASAANAVIDSARVAMRLPGTSLVANGPVALSLAMEAVDTGLNGGIEEGLRFEASAFGVSAATADRMEGTRAFLEKRKPAFQGK